MSCCVPELWDAQVRPPSLLLRIAPPAPTATQSWLVDGQLTAFRSELVPEDRGLQLDPPSLVEMIVPAAPTATQLLAAAQLMPFRSLPWGLGLSHRTEPSLRRGPTFELGLGAGWADTAPPNGGQLVVKMSSQLNDGTATTE